MTSPISQTFNGNEWGELLQNINPANKSNLAHGVLIQTDKAIIFKILNSVDEKEIDLTLQDIITISQQILKNCALREKQEVAKGLKHLEQEIHYLGQPKAQGPTAALIEEDKLSQFFAEMNELQESAKLSSQEEVKLQLEDIYNQVKINNQDIEVVKVLIKNDISLLFNLSDYGESFFDFVADKCPKEVLAPLVKEVLSNFSLLNKSQIEKFKLFLFVRRDNESYFEFLMKEDDSNILFDRLLKTLTDLELNAASNRIRFTQVLKYAFSVKRYDYVFLKEKDISSDTFILAEKSVKTLQIEFLSSIKATYGKGAKYKEWLKARQESSTTLKAVEGKEWQSLEAIRWLKAEELRTEYVVKHQGTRDAVKWASLQMLHFLLCFGEEGIKHPGESRKAGEVVRTSGGWAHVYCSAEYLMDNLKAFMPWFNENLRLCEEKKINPIIFAAQAYQRLVSYHVFENGNGRFARLVMDYVLERFFLPPPVLGKDILDAVFPLDSPVPHQEKFIIKIIYGIQESKRLLT